MSLPETEEFNRLFVKEIEQRPLLYNTSLKEYSNPVEKKRAWRKIAHKFNTTDADCKLRWKNLRTCFVRYTKSTNGSTVKKPYYLSNIMQFILPHIKSIPQSDPLSTLSQPPENFIAALDSDNLEDDIKIDDGVGVIIHEDDSSMSDVTHSESGASGCPCTTTLRKKKSVAKSGFHPDDLKRALTGYIAAKEETKNEFNPDLDFLRSLLPDIAQFNPAQKRKFKRQVLQLIDDILLQ